MRDQSPAEFADRVPAPRPVPTTRERLTDARTCGHTPQQHRRADGQEADDASHDRAMREITAERDRLADDHAKALQRIDRLDREAATWKQRLVEETARLRDDLDSTQQVATFRQGVIDQYRDEIGACGEVIAVVRDAQEQIERALARFDTTPEVSPVEAGEEQPEPHEDPRRLRQQLADAHADCARYATERDQARAALADPLRAAAKDLRLLADQHSIDSLGFGIGWAADRLDDWASTPDEAGETTPPGSPSPRAQELLHSASENLLQHLDTIQAHWVTLLPRDVGETLLARGAALSEALKAVRRTQADPVGAEQALRDRVEHAIRARLASMFWPYPADQEHLDRVAAVAAVAAVEAMTDPEPGR